MKYREEINRIYKTEGLYGFTRGYTGLLVRDCFGFAIYFFLFDLFKRTFNVHISQIAYANFDEDEKKDNLS
jgi:hypothetical protein